MPPGFGPRAAGSAAASAGCSTAPPPDAELVALLQQQYVAEGRIHYFLGGGRMGGSMGGSDAARQISAWVQQHFAATSVGGATVYDLTG